MTITALLSPDGANNNMLPYSEKMMMIKARGFNKIFQNSFKQQNKIKILICIILG